MRPVLVAVIWLLPAVAQAQSADDNVEIFARAQVEPHFGERDLRGREGARHEEFVAELDLVDIFVRTGEPPPAQAYGADRGRAEIQFLEIDAHRFPFFSCYQPMRCFTNFAR